jgi:hypothetical protein
VSKAQLHAASKSSTLAVLHFVLARRHAPLQTADAVTWHHLRVGCVVHMHVRNSLPSLIHFHIDCKHHASPLLPLCETLHAAPSCAHHLGALHSSLFVRPCSTIMRPHLGALHSSLFVRPCSTIMRPPSQCTPLLPFCETLQHLHAPTISVHSTPPFV